MTLLRYLIIILTALGIGGLFSSQIKGFETLRAEGRTVFLELRPVDPRALMLGDYMALRYDQDRLSEINKVDLPPKGTLVFREEEGVAKFYSVHADTLNEDEFRLAYVKQKRELNFGGPRFYFENGTAQDYEVARYGVFKVDESGKAVLVSLADANRKIINPKPR